MIHFKDIIARHGGDPACFFEFEEPDDQIHLLPYATLTAARADKGVLQSLVGVYEWQNAPLFMLVNGEALGDNPDDFTRLRRLVAMRGDAHYLAIVQMGRVTFHDIGLDNRDREQTEALSTDSDQRALLIPHVANTRPGQPSKERWISDVILKLLSDALDAVTALGIDSGDAISLVGRALFTRFLADRELLEGQSFATTPQAIEALFDDHESAKEVSEWLDNTFNGDFLPLASDRITTFPPEAFHSVGNIMRRAQGGQLPLEWSEDWAKLDFAHIPVGVLSQAYEQYLGLHQKKKQKKEGSFYTPRHIADLMVHASFAALRQGKKAHCAKVLDPAAGAGVFLITAFRQLVKERWEHDRKRPDTRALREILYGSIRGFDINDSALRFAALGLYLISIELDPAPKPVEKLKFKENLRQSVIFKLGHDEDPDGSKDLGSLGDEVGSAHDGQYDLVIGNPPWSSGTDLPDWNLVLDRVSNIARVRLNNPSEAPPLPNEVLDLPFVWRAMEWAKPNAQIAFALHARLLFQRGEGMDRALSALLRSLNVTGVINGSEVRQSKVWPNVDAPFCLLFARNAVPAPGSGFRFVSPHLEGPLNQTGGWRIDVTQADEVRVDQVLERPEILKVLYRGSQLDREVLERVSEKGLRSFGEYWSDLHGGTPRQPRCAGNGYKKLFATSRANPAEGGERGYSAEQMYPLPVLEHSNFDRVLLQTERFRKFSELGIKRLDQRRSLSLYSGPMMLIRKSPSAGASRIRCAVSLSDLAFNETYYGYTAHKQDYGADLAKYLCLVISSKFTLWHSLMTSGEFGFERDVVEKYVVQEVPLYPFQELNHVQRDQATSLFAEISEEETTERWDAVDRWVGSLFGLTPDDVQTIGDTLAFALPFAENKKAAWNPPSKPALEAYRRRLESEIEPWGERFGRKMSVTKVEAAPLSPWEFVAISANGTTRDDRRIEAVLHQAIQQTADALSSSEIIYRDDKHDCLFLGRLNQARYWSVSQARLAAQHIIWDHIDFISGNRAA